MMQFQQCTVIQYYTLQLQHEIENLLTTYCITVDCKLHHGVCWNCIYWTVTLLTSCTAADLAMCSSTCWCHHYVACRSTCSLLESHQLFSIQSSIHHDAAYTVMQLYTVSDTPSQVHDHMWQCSSSTNCNTVVFMITDHTVGTTTALTHEIENLLTHCSNWTVYCNAVHAHIMYLAWTMYYSWAWITASVLLHLS